MAFRIFGNAFIGIGDSLITIAMVIIGLLNGNVFCLPNSISSSGYAPAGLALAVKAISRFGVFAKFCSWQKLLAF